MSLSSCGISPLIVRAYRAAHYEIQSGVGPIRLRIGAVSIELSALMREMGATTGALLTAYNPESQRRSDAENKKAQDALEDELASMTFRTIKGEGRSRSGDWPAEPSVFVFNISLTDAEELAKKYAQNGFLWAGTSDGYCSLRLLGPLLVPNAQALSTWREGLATDESAVAALLSPRVQADLMTVSDAERRHWLFPSSWRLDQPWPYVRPDGSAMGIGTELDRNFKLIAAGMTATFSEYV